MIPASPSPSPLISKMKGSPAPGFVPSGTPHCIRASNLRVEGTLHFFLGSPVAAHSSPAPVQDVDLSLSQFSFIRVRKVTLRGSTGMAPFFSSPTSELWSLSTGTFLSPWRLALSLPSDFYTFLFLCPANSQSLEWLEPRSPESVCPPFFGSKLPHRRFKRPRLPTLGPEEIDDSHSPPLPAPRAQLSSD